jgi:hypothetical protein
MHPHLTPTAFDDWVRAYGRAWETGDPSAVVTLFAADAAYHETPFDEPMVGTEAIRQYWSEGAGLSQRDVRFGFTTLATTDRTGIAHWRASFTRVPSGVGVELDGVLAAEFDGEGRRRVFREWWHRRESPAGSAPAGAGEPASPSGGGAG